ncbi:hypothetical protein CMI41_02810, partial [Candidatus Pacearchaeota archaeon]|nr:hypothetical protein [Candidatus Pacearchaeota archaeon]
MEKDGEVTIATIVAIALAVVLLVFLVYGFSVGWGNFWDKITDFGGNNVNLDTIRQACSMACMLGGGSDFCVQERSLTIQKGKTTLGSCFDFSEKNPSLGIEECDTCSMASGGCTVGGALDENCDGVSDKVDEVTGEDLLSISMEELLYFEDSEDSEIYSEEECVSGLEQRKIALEIPDKLCYWEAMSEVYDEKCENLNNEDISKIFENKKEYRELNNP